jgi:hypothetical protein
MAGEAVTDKDAGMRFSQPSSSAEPASVASAHALQRATGDLQKHASATEYLPSLGVTLAYVEEALGRLSVGMLQMANGVVEWCGDEGLSADEDTLPPDARALCFHLRAVADALRVPQEACTSSRIWSRRLLSSHPDTEQKAQSPNGPGRLDAESREGPPTRREPAAGASSVLARRVPR